MPTSRCVSDKALLSGLVDIHRADCRHCELKRRGRKREQENGLTVCDAVTKQAAGHKDIPLQERLLWECT